MLIPGFYKIEKIQATESRVNASVRLNPEHEVYKGHFPGQPVVPGVIQLQMIKELMEKAVYKKLFLGQMAFAKYLNAIIPDHNSVLEFKIDFQVVGDQIKIVTTITIDQLVFTKVKGVLVTEETIN